MFCEKCLYLFCEKEVCIRIMKISVKRTVILGAGVVALLYIVPTFIELAYNPSVLSTNEIDIVPELLGQERWECQCLYPRVVQRGSNLNHDHKA